MPRKKNPARMWAVRDSKGTTVAVYADAEEAAYYARRYGAGCHVVEVTPKNRRQNPRGWTRSSVDPDSLSAEDTLRWSGDDDMRPSVARHRRTMGADFDRAFSVLAIPADAYAPATKRVKRRPRKNPKRNPPRNINQKDYAYYVIADTAHGPRIVAGNEYKSDAADAARDLPPQWRASAVVVTKATATRRGLPPDRNSSWGT
jgi:hypothetical protein